MATQPDDNRRTPLVGSLRLPRTPRAGAKGNVSADERVPMIIELDVRYPGGLEAVRNDFYQVWDAYAPLSAAHQDRPTSSTVEPPVPRGLALVAPKLYQCVLSRAQAAQLVEDDRRRVRDGGATATTIFRIWPDYPLYPQIDRSAPTVKADAAWRSYAARGRGVVWAVIDSGIDAAHPHFAGLELAAEAAGTPPQHRSTVGLHRDFTDLVDPANPPVPPPAPPDPAHVTALDDDSGHGTHVAGIIAGCSPDQPAPQVASSQEQQDGGFVPRPHAGALSGMAPDCELISLKVMRRSPAGQWVTSSAAVIRALTYLRMEVNVDPGVLRVHGVNMSLGSEWDPDHYAAGQSPLCQAVNLLVNSGVLVVVSSGNYGARAEGDATTTSAVLGSITEPAHAQECIAVGSTHRDAPHAFGVTYTSGKGPTLDGRSKPDVVAPGEWIASAATGHVAVGAGFPPPGAGPHPATYAELSGTSMAAPHVSGVLAAFLSARPEFIGRPREVKALLTASATDLGRERYAQGAGFVDLMRMLADV